MAGIWLLAFIWTVCFSLGLVPCVMLRYSVSSTWMLEVHIAEELVFNISAEWFSGSGLCEQSVQYACVT